MKKCRFWIKLNSIFIWTSANFEFVFYSMSLIYSLSPFPILFLFVSSHARHNPSSFTTVISHRKKSLGVPLHYLSASHKYFAPFRYENYAAVARAIWNMLLSCVCLQISCIFPLALIHKFSKCQWKQIFFIAFNHSWEFVALLTCVYQNAINTLMLHYITKASWKHTTGRKTWDKRVFFLVRQIILDSRDPLNIKIKQFINLLVWY